jgi:hypothetical protein
LFQIGFILSFFHKCRNLRKKCYSSEGTLATLKKHASWNVGLSFTRSASIIGSGKFDSSGLSSCDISGKFKEKKENESGKGSGIQ